MITPSLTIVILHRNQTIQLRQLVTTLPEWISEVLIVDDRSDPALLSEWQDWAQKQVSLSVRVVERPLTQGFAEQRNWALRQVKTEWTLFIDADERPADAFFPQLRQLLTQPGERRAYQVLRNQVLAGRELLHGDGGQQPLVRLAQTSAGQGRWQGAVHEVWVFPPAEVARSSLTIRHENAANLTEFMAKLNAYAPHEIRDRQGSTISSLIVELLIFPLLKFLFNFLWRGGIFDGFAGFAHAWLMSYYSAIVRIFVYEEKCRA